MAAFNADKAAFMSADMGHDRSTQMTDEHWQRVVDLLQKWHKKPESIEDKKALKAFR